MAKKITQKKAQELRKALVALLDWYKSTPEFKEGTDKMPLPVFNQAQDALYRP